MNNYMVIVLFSLYFLLHANKDWLLLNHEYLSKKNYIFQYDRIRITSINN